MGSSGKMILGIVVGRACEVVPVGLAVGDENEKVVGSMTMVLGSQLFVFDKVAVGRMLVTPGSVVVDGTTVVVSDTLVGTTVDLEVVVGITVTVELSEVIGTVVALPVGGTETVPLVIEISVTVGVEIVPVVVVVVLPTGRSVVVVGMLVMAEPEEVVAVTGGSVEVALGSDT